jgi:hypothetical protein
MEAQLGGWMKCPDPRRLSFNTNVLDRKKFRSILPDGREWVELLCGFCELQLLNRVSNVTKYSYQVGQTV